MPTTLFFDEKTVFKFPNHIVFGIQNVLGLWYYPTADIADDDFNTYWLARLNDRTATVWIDLG